MLTKEQYTAAQALSRELIRTAEYKSSESLYEIGFEAMMRFLFKFHELNIFAAQVAETVEKSMNPYSATVCRLSEKQAWCLAAAAVENKFEFNL